MDQRREKRAGRAPVFPERRYEERPDSSSASGLEAEENMVYVRPEENKKRSHKRIKKESRALTGLPLHGTIKCSYILVKDEPSSPYSVASLPWLEGKGKG